MEINTNAPSFTLSPGNGTKTVYFKVKNDSGESFACNDAITIGETGTITNSLGMTFKYIPPGTFWMGSPDDEWGRDGWMGGETQHQVTLTKGFYIQATEMTLKQWWEVMGTDDLCYCGDSCLFDCPVACVSWNDVSDFIEEINTLDAYTYRLPTEAEWEYACRAGSTTAFANGGITETDCGGDEGAGSPKDLNLDAMGWYTYNSSVRAHPVAQKQANDWGLYDMHGNVMEWCSDWYGTYPTGVVTDPTGPSTGLVRIRRGGSWDSCSRNCRSASRHHFYTYPGSWDEMTGFRLVLLPNQ